MPEEDLLELKFWLLDGSDIGLFRYSPASTVAMLKKRIVAEWPKAVKFYKPWILLSSADLKGIYGLLEKCDSLWSTSGVEEAIPVKSLLESLNHIQNLDALALVNEFVSQKESQCRLSLLSPGVVPEMKMVVWNGDKYFVTLANLWGNLISPNPPKLSSIHIG